MIRVRIILGLFRRPAFWLIVLGCALSASLVTAAPGQGQGPKHADNFIGLWEGVDPLDGSMVRVSLSDIDNDGVLELTQQEDFWSFCFAKGSGYSKGRGVVRGTATVASRNVLDTLATLVCISDDNNGTEQGDPSPNQYLLRSRDRNLVLPEFGSSPAIVLHRIAE